jgi:hypothetical protein
MSDNRTSWLPSKDELFNLEDFGKILGLNDTGRVRKGKIVKIGVAFFMWLVVALVLFSCSGATPPPGVPGGDGELTLIKGTPATDEDLFLHPVVKIVTGNAGCTATVVGKRALITASHCISTGATSRFTVSYGPHKGQTFTAKVTRSPYYKPGPAAYDHALGYLDRDFPGVPASVHFDRLEVGQEVTLSGYGCTQPGGAGGSDGRLRFGSNLVRGRNAYDSIVGSTTNPQAALCFGDSGGPLFIEIGGKWYLVGVNSKGNISTVSYIARMDIDESKKFLTDWSFKYDAKICGLNAPAEECGGAEPPKPQQFVQENAFYKLTVDVKDGQPHKLEVVKSLFQMLMDWLLVEPPIVEMTDVFLSREPVVILPEPLP